MHIYIPSKCINILVCFFVCLFFFGGGDSVITVSLNVQVTNLVHRMSSLPAKYNHTSPSFTFFFYLGPYLGPYVVVGILDKRRENFRRHGRAVFTQSHAQDIQTTCDLHPNLAAN